MSAAGSTSRCPTAYPAERVPIPKPAASPVTSALDTFFESYFRLRPVNATFTGEHAYDTFLPDWSTDGLTSAIGEMQSLRAKVGKLEGGKVGKWARTDVQLADAFLEIQIAEMEGTHFQRGNPALFTGEAIFSIVSLMLNSSVPASQRSADIEARLRKLPAFLESGLTTLRCGTVPASWLERATTECLAGEELLTNGLTTWCVGHKLGATASEALRRSATAASTALSDFGHAIARFEAHETAGACGSDFFELLLRRGHWCDRPPTELLEHARDALQQGCARLKSLSAPRGGWPAVQTRLTERHPTADNYLATFEQTWESCRTAAEAHDLVTWPDSPIRYGTLPAWARGSAPHLYFLNYRSPAPLDPPDTTEYLVPAIEAADASEQERRLRAVNSSVIKLNHVVHHGALGHHVQNAAAYEGPSRVGKIAAVDCASRIGMFCGGTMAEGWACYATDLAEEMGFLEKDETIAEQHSRVRQLARAVVDIEFHRGTMSHGDAEQFFHVQTGASHEAARKEITRSSMFPGTALMYWLGTDAIHSLRKERSVSDGAAFSLRAFHDTFLSYGSIPVPLIGQLMLEGS